MDQFEQLNTDLVKFICSAGLCWQNGIYKILFVKNNLNLNVATGNIVMTAFWLEKKTDACVNVMKRFTYQYKPTSYQTLFTFIDPYSFFVWSTSPGGYVSPIWISLPSSQLTYLLLLGC